MKAIFYIRSLIIIIAFTCASLFAQIAEMNSCKHANDKKYTSDYIVVANQTERNAIPFEDRKEGLLVVCIDTYGKYQLRDGITNSDWVYVGVYINKTEATENVIYYLNSIIGSDEDGDGSTINPWATINYSLTQTPSILTAGNLTLVCQAGGTYYIDGITQDLLAEYLINKQLVLQGEMYILRDDFTAKIADPNGNPYKKISTVTWSSDNEYIGYIVRHDNYAPDYEYSPMFPHNTTNVSTSLNAEGFWAGAIMGIESTLIFSDQKAFKQLVGSSIFKIEYFIVNPGITNKNLAIDNLSAVRLQFENCVINTPNNKSLKLANNIMLYKCIVITSNTDKDAIIIEETNKVQFSHVSIYNSNPADNSWNSIYIKKSDITFDKVYIYGFAYAIDYRRGSNLSIRYGHYPNIFENIGCVFRITTSNSIFDLGEWYGTNKIYIYDCNYLWALQGGTDRLYFVFPENRLVGDSIPNIQAFVPTTGGAWQGNPTLLTSLRNKPISYIDPLRQVSFYYKELYPEIEINQSKILTDNTTTDIIIGDTTQNKAIKINYQLERSTGARQGIIEILYHESALTINENNFDNGIIEVQDPALIFSTLFSTDKIILRAILNSSGNDADITYSIKRQMQ